MARRFLDDTLGTDVATLLSGIATSVWLVYHGEIPEPLIAFVWVALAAGAASSWVVVRPEGVFGR